VWFGSVIEKKNHSNQLKKIHAVRFGSVEINYTNQTNLLWFALVWLVRFFVFFKEKKTCYSIAKNTI